MSSDFSDPGPGLAPEAPAAPPALPASAPRPAAMPKSPGLAAVLSLLFPGIGQVYNGQPAKALVFFFGFTGALWASIEAGPLPYVFLIPFTIFYGIVDAYRSAALLNARGVGAPAEEDSTESPAWGIALVALGLVFLLNNLGWLRLAALSRFWPLVLVALGVAFLMGSLRRRKDGGDASRP